MEWYYALNDQRLGPVPAAEFDRLVRAGTITPQTLVWREGLAEWQPHAALAPAAATVLLAGSERCAECGQAFPQSEMLAFEKLHVCAACKPVFFQKVQEGVAVGAARVWRSGKFVVMGLKAELPDTCVKCHAPVAGSKLKRKLRWHPPLVYLALLLNILIYAIIAAIMSKKADVDIGICAVHRAKRVRAMVIAWVLSLGGLAAIPWGISVDEGWLAGAGAVTFVAGLIWGVVGGRVVFAKKIDKEQAWVGGCCPAYLDALPEWRGS
jgi:hypothetical protein